MVYFVDAGILESYETANLVFFLRKLKAQEFLEPAQWDHLSLSVNMPQPWFGTFWIAIKILGNGTNSGHETQKSYGTISNPSIYFEGERWLP